MHSPCQCAVCLFVCQWCNLGQCCSASVQLLPVCSSPSASVAVNKFAPEAIWYYICQCCSASAESLPVCSLSFCLPVMQFRPVLLCQCAATASVQFPLCQPWTLSIDGMSPDATPLPMADSNRFWTLVASSRALVPETSNTLPAVQPREADSPPTVQPQEADLLPTGQPQEADSLPTGQLQQADLLPTGQPQEADSLPTVQPQEADPLPKFSHGKLTSSPLFSHRRSHSPLSSCRQVFSTQFVLSRLPTHPKRQLSQ